MRTPPAPAAYNMAVDEALVDACRRGASGPTLRVYGWDRPAVSLGYFQRAESVVDVDRCRSEGLAVVRRTTGGGAVCHQLEVTYAVTAPIPHPLFPSSIRGAYAGIAAALADGLRRLDLPIVMNLAPSRGRERRPAAALCFDSTARHEFTLDGHKIVGSAQRRWKTAFLQHGSILIRYDPDLAARAFLHAPRGPVIGLATRDAAITRDQVERLLIEAWERTFHVSLTPAPLHSLEDEFVAESSHTRDLTVTPVG